MKKLLIMVLLLTGIIFSQSATADIPKTINYQGRLTDMSGNPLPDGNYSIAVRLYESESAAESAAVWSDNYSVETKSGYFNVMLGSNASFPLNLPFNQQYYLGIKVGTDTEMTPRHPLSSVPYAMSAGMQFIGFQILTTSGTYTPSEGTRAILVEAQGGGGGGGGAASGTGIIGVGAGGRGGGYCMKYISAVAASYSYVVGGGGSGGAAGVNGDSGGNTTFGLPLLLNAEGGMGGGGNSGIVPPQMWSTGGSSQTNTTGGDINKQCENSGYAFSLSETQGTGGSGASSKFGRGGTPGYNGNDGNDGIGYGAGGGGASSISSVNRTGGNGTQGIIVVWEFK